MAEGRPDPDALLARVKEQEARQRRGRLKVFFGAAAGVGKTYAMLEAAREQRADGVDVVVGWVETHGRAETEALLEGLEILPPRLVEHRGAVLREFDLDAALARRPALLIVDELAHTNAPGSRHAKRWQAVLELLDAGIDVYTTVNVQHVESLNDVVAKVTGVVVRETVPDSVLDQADEVELVDLPPDDLLERLREGKVYMPHLAQEAVQSFFRKGNLIALRELALRRTADRVDAEMRDYMRDHAIRQTWPVAERLLVCVGPSPFAPHLVRAARRMAERLDAPWIVAYVETPAQLRLPAEARDRVVQTLRLAEQLGAEAVTLSGQRMSDEILAFARERNVSTIVVGKPGRSFWKRIFLGSIVDTLVEGSGEIDVYVISGDREDTGAASASSVRPAVTDARAYGYAVAMVAAVSAVGWVLFPVSPAGKPGHALPARRGRHRHARRPGSLGRRRRPERGRVRLPVRAAVPHLRGVGHPVPGDVRGHADGQPGHQRPHRADPRRGRAGPPARAPDGGALRDEPGARQYPRDPTICCASPAGTSPRCSGRGWPCCSRTRAGGSSPRTASAPRSRWTPRSGG